MACDVQNLPYEYFSAEQYEMLYLLHEHWSNNRHMLLNDTDFALFWTKIYIKPMLLQNGPHQNLSTRGFDKNVFQILLHNIYRKPLP
jgi:hypothetical protein